MVPFLVVIVLIALVYWVSTQLALPPMARTVINVALVVFLVLFLLRTFAGGDAGVGL